MTARISKCCVEIAGIIASGKTTFAGLFESLDATDLVLESFAANPFYAAFYRDPADAAFEAEISFLLLHAYALRRSRGPVTVCDFASVLDRAYSRVTLDAAQRAAFDPVWQYLTNRRDQPSLLVRLRCPPEVALERIRCRGREAEQSITHQYLVSLDAALETAIEQSGQPHIDIDSYAIDFRLDEQVRRALLAKVFSLLKSLATDGAIR